MVRFARTSDEPLLNGDIWETQLAPPANAPENRVSEIVRRVDARLSREIEPSIARIIMEMTLVLAGEPPGEPACFHLVSRTRLGGRTSR